MRRIRHTDYFTFISQYVSYGYTGLYRIADYIYVDTDVYLYIFVLWQHYPICLIKSVEIFLNPHCLFSALYEFEIPVWFSCFLFTRFCPKMVGNFQWLLLFWFFWIFFPFIGKRPIFFQSASLYFPSETYKYPQLFKW